MRRREAMVPDTFRIASRTERGLTSGLTSGVVDWRQRAPGPGPRRVSFRAWLNCTQPENGTHDNLTARYLFYMIVASP